MSRLQLTLACGDYVFLCALFVGPVTAPGIDLNVLTMASPERHGRMLRHEEFDVCELSLVGYLVARDRGCNYTAIPVFPHRRFRHSYMIKRTGCGIEKPSDLNDKRVGLDTLQNSAGVWMRGILQDYYGVDLTPIEWWCEEEEDIPFQRAKEACYERMRDPRSFALVWVQDLMREQREIFGADPWPYNLEDNRKALEAAIRYEYEQGMIKKKPQVEELFFPASLQRIQHYV